MSHINRLHRAAARRTRTVRIPAAHPVYVRRRGTGVELDVTALASDLLRQLAEAYRDDPANTGDLLTTLADIDDRIVDPRESRANRPWLEQWRDDLLTALFDLAGPAKQQLHGRAARELTAALAAFAGQDQALLAAVPTQREGREAA